MTCVSALIALALCGAAVRGSEEPPDSAPRPNIVVIVCDDLGFSDLGCYGGEIRTPRLDRLASEGVRFSQFYNCAKCTETRATLLSGLYHHQSRNLRVRNHVTIPEVLSSAGYTTLMVGKWHVGTYAMGARQWSFDDRPTHRGFDRYFGFLTGAINYFTGRELGNDLEVMVLDDAPYLVPEDFYSTDAFTDRAIEFLKAAARKERPFFLYLAHNAPHFPLQALPEDIERYRGRYRAGWDETRRRRHARQIELGIVDAAWGLTPRDPIVPDWDSLTEEQRAEEDLLMAVYAAMVDRLDRGVGRVLDALDSLGVAESTLVMFFSDNGGCCWSANRTPSLPPGPEESGRSYDTEWANVSNTPFRLYKQYSHEGGVSTPCIVRWPGVVRPGTITREVAHLVDLMPTFVEVAGATYPDRFAEHPVLPLEGRSMIPILRGGSRPDAPLYWEYVGNRAVRRGKWKLVAERSKDWELYDVVADRCELHDVRDRHPQLARELAELYDAWAARTGARTNAQGKAMRPSTQTRYLEP